MAYSLSPLLKPRFFVNATNKPLVGGKLYSYLAETTTPATTYSNDTGTPNTNPIILDANGECNLYLDDDKVYRLILKDANDVTYFDKDRVSSIGGGDYKVLTFDTIADLRLKIGSPKEPVAQTSGYYAAGDGGGNSFYWDGTSSATDNGGTIIKPTFVSGAGRWLAIDTINVNIRQFGAKGDGVTDDTNAITTANTLVGILKGELFFPQGVYNVAGRLAPIAPLCSWRGVSHWYNQFTLPNFAMPNVGTVIDGGATNLDVIAGNLTDIYIKNINIRGTGTGACLHATSGSRLSTFSEIACNGKEYGIRTSGAVTYILKFDRIFTAKQTVDGVFFDWGTGAHNEISLLDSWVFRPDGKGINASGTGGGCTILNLERNSITDGTGDTCAVSINGVQCLTLMGNDVEGWGAIYSDPVNLTGKLGYQPNARCFQITAQSGIIASNVTYGCGNNFSPMRLLTCRQLNIGSNRFLKDLSTQTYAISIDAASSEITIEPQTYDFPAASITTGATNITNCATGSFVTNALSTFNSAVTLNAATNLNKPLLFPTPSVVASATTISIPDEPCVIISGTTNINFITGKARQIVVLEFQDVLTVEDSPPSAGNLRLSGNFTTTAGATLTLMSRGASSSWLEISRSAN